MTKVTSRKYCYCHYSGNSQAKLHVEFHKVHELVIVSEFAYINYLIQLICIFVLLALLVKYCCTNIYYINK